MNRETWSQFVVMCLERTIYPELALDNAAVKKALDNNDLVTVEILLDTEF